LNTISKQSKIRTWSQTKLWEDNSCVNQSCVLSSWTVINIKYSQDIVVYLVSVFNERLSISNTRRTSSSSLFQYLTNGYRYQILAGHRCLFGFSI